MDEPSPFLRYALHVDLHPGDRHWNSQDRKSWIVTANELYRRMLGSTLPRTTTFLHPLESALTPDDFCFMCIFT
jgi:hypothetical protein